MDKPIGYWLKHLHNLLESQFERALADGGMGRRDWQVLNSLRAGPRSRAELRRALLPFWDEGEPDLHDVLDGSGGLAARSWVRDRDGAIALTDEGRAAHEAARRRVERTRTVVLGELTPGEYAETVRVLSVMAANVERELASPTA